MTDDLFAAKAAERLAAKGPLASRLRPKKFSDVVGQDHLIGVGAPLRVLVEQPKFSYIVNDETYGISVDSIDLTPRDRAQGSYAVTYPSEMNVVFSISGHVPEYYTVVPDQQVALLLRAQGDSLQCSGFPGTKRCDDAAPTAPLVSFSAQLPSSMVLEITLNNQKKSAHFRLPSIDAPIYQPIPADMDNALHGFVGILRQAMVF